MFDHDNFPEFIMIHHSDSKDDRFYLNWLDIYKWHVLENKWSYPGYHYGIELANEEAYIIPGRPEWSRGAHCNTDGMNNKSIGICIIGNYNNAVPDEKVLDKLYDLIRDIYIRYGRKLTVVGHREHNQTSCPGDMFPLDEVKRKADEIWEEVKTPYAQIDHRTALDELGKRKLSNGEAVVGFPVQWQAKLLHTMIDSDSVKWLLRKVYKYLQENNI